MLSNIDFPSPYPTAILKVLCHAAQSLGPSSADWECEVKEALSVHRRSVQRLKISSSASPKEALSFELGSRSWELSRNVIFAGKKVTPTIKNCGHGICSRIRVPSSSVVQGADPKFCLANPGRRTFGLLLAMVPPINGFNELENDFGTCCVAHIVR